MSFECGDKLHALRLAAQHCDLTRMISNEGVLGQRIEPRLKWKSDKTLSHIQQRLQINSLECCAGRLERVSAHPFRCFRAMVCELFIFASGEYPVVGLREYDGYDATLMRQVVAHER